MNSCDFPPLNTLLDMPPDALAAVTHADPYPFYDKLAAKPGLHFDAGLGLWVAASAKTVKAVMRHPDCRVRPLSEPVPAAIAGGAAGRIFSALVRMNEDERHETPRLALQRALAYISPFQARRSADEIARRLWRDGDLSAWMLATPVSTVASMMGFPDEQLPQVVGWMEDFVACLSPLSSAQQIAQAHAAAQELLQQFAQMVQEATEAASGVPAESLLANVIAEAQAVGWNDSAALLANLAGLLSQTYEATAGLIGNSLVALVRQPEDERSEPEDAATLVHTVIRCDPPVQNTRRFVTHTCEVGGALLREGETILLLLAAASRDPAAECHEYGFGYGAHSCPGQIMASAIATGAMEMLMSGPMRSAEILQSLRWTYRQSLNVRIPVFTRA